MRLFFRWSPQLRKDTFLLQVSINVIEAEEKVFLAELQKPGDWYGNSRCHAPLAPKQKRNRLYKRKGAVLADKVSKWNTKAILVSLLETSTSAKPRRSAPAVSSHFTITCGVALFKFKWETRRRFHASFFIMVPLNLTISFFFTEIATLVNV